MNDRSHPRERISAWLDGELTGEERAAVERHLESCAECRELVENLRSLAADAALEPVPPVPEDLPSRIRRRIRKEEEAARPRRSWFFRALPWSAAASLAAAALLLAIFLPAEWQKQRAPVPTPVASPPPVGQAQSVAASEEPAAPGPETIAPREAAKSTGNGVSPARHPEAVAEATPPAPPAPVERKIEEKTRTPAPSPVQEAREERAKTNESQPSTAPERRAEEEAFAPTAGATRDFAQIVGGEARKRPAGEESLRARAPAESKSAAPAPVFGALDRGKKLRRISQAPAVSCDAPWRVPVTEPISWPPETEAANVPNLGELVRRADGRLQEVPGKTGILRAWIPGAAWPGFRKSLREAGAAGLNGLPEPPLKTDCVTLDFAIVGSSVAP